MQPPTPNPKPGAARVPPLVSAQALKSPAGPAGPARAARRRPQPSRRPSSGPGQKPRRRQRPLVGPSLPPSVTFALARLVGGYGYFDKRRLELVFSVSIGQLEPRLFAVLEVLFLHANVLRGIPAPVAVPSQPCLSAKDLVEVMVALKKAYPALFSGLFHDGDPRAMMNVINKIRGLLACPEVIRPVIMNGENGRGYCLNQLIESVSPAPLNLPSPGGQAPGLPVQPDPEPAQPAFLTGPGACGEVPGKDAGACLVS